jgi:hypothetical protein
LCFDTDRSREDGSGKPREARRAAQKSFSTSSYTELELISSRAQASPVSSFVDTEWNFESRFFPAASLCERDVILK